MMFCSLFHREKRKVVGTELASLPREGDLIWLNSSGFRVEKIVHFYSQNNSSNESYAMQTLVYLQDASEEEINNYHPDNFVNYDREDYLSHLS